MYRGALLSLTAFGLFAAEPACELTMPDIARSVERFNSGAFGKAWNNPGMAPVRAAVDKALAGFRDRERDPRFVDPEVIFAHLLATPPSLVSMRAAGTGSSEIVVRGVQAIAVMKETLPKSDSVHLREVGDTLFLSPNVEVNTDLPAPSDADLILRWNADAMSRWTEEALPPRQAENLLPIIREFLSDGSCALRLTERGMSWELRLAQQPAGIVPVRREQLAVLSLPPTSFIAVGVDGGAWWNAHRDGITAMLAAQGQSEALALADQMISSFGIEGGIQGLLAGIKGEVIIAGDAGAGFLGAMAVALPRSPGIDRLVATGLGFLQIMPPAVGAFSVLSMRPPGLGAADDFMQRIAFAGVSVGRTAEHWWISTDAVLMSDILEGHRPALQATDTGKALLAQVDDQTSVVLSGDGRAMMRALIPMLTQLGGVTQTPDGPDAVARALLSLYRQSGPSLSIGRGGPEGFTLSGDGLDGGVFAVMPSNIAMVAIIAAIAIPNLLESRVSAQESAAAATLKSGVMPAMVQFQAGAYVDADGDGIGEYSAPFPVLSGVEPIQGVTLRLLAPTFNQVVPQVSGYRYYLFWPTAQDAASRELLADVAAGADLRERYWVAYAVPVDPGQGRRIFAVNQAGMVYALPPSPGPFAEPQWNDLMNGGTWLDQPAGAWMPYRR